MPLERVEMPVPESIQRWLGHDQLDAVLTDGKLVGMHRALVMPASVTMVDDACLSATGLFLISAGRNLWLGSAKCASSWTCLSEEASELEQLVAGGAHFLLLSQSGGLSGMGDNRFGQLGVTRPVRVERPTRIETDELEIVQIAAGDLHSAFVTRQGGLYVFGDDTNGQVGGLGGGEPCFVDLGEDVDVQSVLCGTTYTIARTTQGAFVAGTDAHHELGSFGRATYPAFVAVD
ncbi:uncharacterized protein L969DRAFT_191581 [Mixia osmundae IAM 14324]|nr:uncharacterized protein L969DRAFT_191581 [Mixia osmundae IAM 14324]KEI37302.1 hypothetical protein L969DRAFT_191581 [Mixia osmundae IAM 14324]